MNLTDITSAVEAIAKEAGAFLRKQQSTFSQERVSLKSLNALVSDVDENTERLLLDPKSKARNPFVLVKCHLLGLRWVH